MATIENAPVNNNIHAYPTSFALKIIIILQIIKMEIIFMLLANINNNNKQQQQFWRKKHLIHASKQKFQLSKLENPKNNSQKNRY
jgi:hypothetical protein